MYNVSKTQEERKSFKIFSPKKKMQNTKLEFYYLSLSL